MTTNTTVTQYCDQPSENGPLECLPQQARPEDPPSYNDAAVPPSKPTFGERFHRLSSKAGWPLNKAANVVGAEGWWPDSVEKEAVKAARILYSFTDLADRRPPRTNGPMHATGLTRKSMVKMPPQVLQNCAGLAIFNTIRAGAWHGSLSGGSGVVIARRQDGTWSPPSSFIVSALGAGFMFGLDVYDCVCVLNTPAQVQAFARPRLSLGGNATVAVGPVGGGAAVNAAVSKSGKPVWSYIKSRGLWAGLSVDGTVIVSRGDANSVFYKERGITASKILQGDVAWPAGAKPLFEVLKALEGRRDVDHAVVDEVGGAPAPGGAMGAGATPPPVDYVDVKHGDEKQSDSEARQEGDDDLYASSVVDEKEMLAKSGC